MQFAGVVMAEVRSGKFVSKKEGGVILSNMGRSLFPSCSSSVFQCQIRFDMQLSININAFAFRQHKIAMNEVKLCKSGISECFSTYCIISYSLFLLRLPQDQRCSRNLPPRLPRVSEK